MNASTIAAALGERAEAVCRQYLPHGRRQGRYWVAGDLDGARGRSLFVRLAPPGTPGKWTDAAEGQHGDLLDLICHRAGAPTLRAALDEARAFLALPAAPAAGEGGSYDATEAARCLWRRCRAIDGTHAERYLQARGLARCRFAALRFHPELRYREASSVRRLPALVAAVTGDDGAVLVPKGDDFNDDLLALGAPELAARFAPLFRFAGGREEQGGGQAHREKGGRRWSPS